MMKTLRIGFLVWIVMSYCTVMGQDWVGHLFELDTIIGIQDDFVDGDLLHLVSAVNNGVFYYTEANAYSENGRVYTASIHSLDLGSYMHHSFTLSVPISMLKRAGYVGKPWIYDFHFLGDVGVVSIQDMLLVYLREGQQYIFDTLYRCENAKVCYLYGGDIYYLEENHDVGYRWYRLRGGHVEFVRALDYEAPHVVQAKPNRYIFHDDRHLFFLSTRFPQLDIYMLDGVEESSVSFELPDWHPFEEEYIRRSMEYPYGVERIKATMSEIFQYSYLKLVFPIGGEYLLYYTQYDPDAGRSSLQFAVCDVQGRVHQYGREVPDDMVYSRKTVPFTLLERVMDKAYCSWNDCLIEIVLADTVDYEGLQEQEYLRRREAFYETAAPYTVLKISSYKNAQPCSLLSLYDGERCIYALQDLPQGKHVLLLNGSLDCSGCRDALMLYLDGLDGEGLHKDILYPYYPGALARYEINQKVRKNLHSFSLYYLAHDRYREYPYSFIDSRSSFPSILLYEAGNAPIYIPLEEIFEDGVTTNAFRKTFIERVEQFLDS